MAAKWNGYERGCCQQSLDGVGEKLKSVWEAVALHLADRAQACVLLSAGLEIRMVSAALEKTLGVEREQLEGRSWTEVVTPPELAAVTRIRLHRAVAGVGRTIETEAMTREGQRLLLVFDAALIGRCDEQSLLLTLLSARPAAQAVDLRVAGEVDYDISSSVSDFGRLLAVTNPAGAVPISGETRCYSVIANRTAPCTNCPVLRPDTEGWPRTEARRVGAKSAVYEVVTAEGGGARVHMRLRRIPEASVSAIYETKVRDLADAARLSERERAVLTYLLMGRAIGDIASILDISPRTVKFHQANVLEKLGADSRADLIRLIT